MNNEFCCFECATTAMSATAATGDGCTGTPSIPRMVNGACPVCGSDETIDLSCSGR